MTGVTHRRGLFVERWIADLLHQLPVRLRDSNGAPR